MWWDLEMDPDGEIILSCAPRWAHPTPSDMQVCAIGSVRHLVHCTISLRLLPRMYSGSQVYMLYQNNDPPQYTHLALEQSGDVRFLETSEKPLCLTLKP